VNDGVVVLIGCALAVTCAAIVDGTLPRLWSAVKRFGGRVLIVTNENQNIHDEKEAEPVRCLNCQRPAMLLFGDDDVLRVVCRNPKCAYVEVV
jgi:hypothetical protein